jgi:hypothetical protein
MSSNTAYIIDWQKRNPEKVAIVKKRYYAKVGDRIKKKQKDMYDSDILCRWQKQADVLARYHWRKNHPFEVQCLIFGRIKI